MQETPWCFHNLEWPPAGARLAGPILWLRGWVVGKPGFDAVDVRVRHAGQTHLGVLGLPRTDLARHFAAPRDWLPAEFILGVPVGDGPVSVTVEVMEAAGTWHALPAVEFTLAADGAPPPRVEGRLETHAGGTHTVRDAHHPFHGHLDQPGPTPELHDARVPVFGWLLDETRPLAAVLATTDTLVFNHLEHSRHDARLAAKFPDRPGAAHARLRGAVDYPLTLVEPACLRVYAVSPEGAVHLCFAQRLRARPATTLATLPADPAPAYAPPPARPLPALPSGRPRRLLVVLRTLYPSDATLRAIDVIGHLTATHRWAVRVVATEEGPARAALLRAGAETQIVDPASWFAAADASAMEAAWRDLERQIRWDHLDAVAGFDPLTGWALALAARRGIPTLLDWVEDEPLRPDPTALPAVQELLRRSWREATVRCFASSAAARAQAPLLHGTPAAIIPHWFSPERPAVSPGESPAALAPWRTVDWLRRRHPSLAARWRFSLGPAGGDVPDQLARRDEAAATAALRTATDWGVAGLSLCLGPLFGRGPLRPALDALAAGLPARPVSRPTTEEIFAGTGLPLVAEGNPLALAHTLLAYDADPEHLAAPTARAGGRLHEAHHPRALLPRWAALLDHVAATRG
jgi:hypothetical protein